MTTVSQQAVAMIDLMAVDGYDKTIYTVQDHATPDYQRNDDCWASSVDLSCCSPWNSYGGNTMAGTLISPRHIIFAAHYPIANGATLRFVTSGGIVETRTLDSQISLEGLHPWGYYPDLVVGKLSADVTNCGFAKILPSNWAEYIPSEPESLPVIGLDQEEKAICFNISSMSEYWVLCKTPTEANRIPYTEGIVSGDSGNPCFLVIDDSPVLLTVWTYGTPGGTNIATWREEIDAAMVALGGGYTSDVFVPIADEIEVIQPAQPEPDLGETLAMGTLYFKKGANANWNTIGNWWKDAAATQQADNVPWAVADVKYLAYDLVYASGTDTVAINLVTSAAITGTCTLNLSVSTGEVFSGTYTSTDLTVSGTIYGGTWNVSGTLTLNGNALYGGIFNAGTVTVNAAKTVYGGAFNCATFNLNGNSILSGGLVVCSGTFTSSDVATIYGGAIISAATFTNLGTEENILFPVWWTSGRLQIGSVVYTSLGGAVPDYFVALATDDCQLTAAQIVPGASVTELGTTVNGAANATAMGPFPTGSTAIGPYPVESASVGPYPVVTP